MIFLTSMLYFLTFFSSQKNFFWAFAMSFLPYSQWPLVQKYIYFILLIICVCVWFSTLMLTTYPLYILVSFNIVSNTFNLQCHSVLYCLKKKKIMYNLMVLMFSMCLFNIPTIASCCLSFVINICPFSSFIIILLFECVFVVDQT